MHTANLSFSSHHSLFYDSIPSCSYHRLFLFDYSIGASSSCFLSSYRSLNCSQHLSFVAVRYPPALFISSSCHPCRSLAFCASWLGNRSNFTQLGGLQNSPKAKDDAALKRKRMNVKNSVTDWRTASRVKVVGLGTRATGALQYCYESTILSSSELWIPCGDAVNLQSFELLNKANLERMDGCSLDESRISPTTRVDNIPTVVVLVIGIGAGLSGKVALDILQSSRVHGSLSVLIVIQPFNFEGLRRKQEIEDLTAGLLEYADLSFVLEHEALFRRERVTLAEALQLADSTSLFAIRAVSDLCLGDQEKVFDTPSEGLREIASAQVLSIFGHAGDAWVGFGSSYSVKSAVQRAACESPFLQGLIPGVKGVVACTISTAEPKERKDLQAAVHALRCIVGPMARLVCTSVKEPSLRQGVVLATILITRIDNGAWRESPMQSVMFPEVSLPITRLTGCSNQNANIVIEGELRKSTSESSVEDTRNCASGTKLDIQEVKQISSLNSLCGSECDQLPEASLSDNDDSSTLIVGDNTLQSDLQDNRDENALKGNNPVRPSVSADRSRPESLEDNATARPAPSSEMVCPSERTTNFSTETEEALSLTGSEGILTTEPVGNDNIKSQSLRLQESESGMVQDQLGMTERLGGPSYPEKSISDEGDDILSKLRIPGLPSILDWGKTNLDLQKKSFNGWESGPNSAAAEAWAQTRRQLRNFGASGIKESNNIPMGVKPTNIGSASHMLGRQQAIRPRLGEPENQCTPFDPGLPLSRVVSSGLDAVADIYKAASAKVLKRNGNDEGKQVSSFLSQRAASMLETERSSGKLMPLVEMNYKNGIYKGRCNGGLPEGKGRLLYADGSFYDGFWKQGKRAGVGSFYYANGDVFQGYWRDDQMHGKGWFYFHTGDRLYSDFWKGKASGEGRFYSAKGDVFFGHFEDNWRHGKCLSIDPSGIRWCEIWDHGVLLSHTQLGDTE